MKIHLLILSSVCATLLGCEDRAAAVKRGVIEAHQELEAREAEARRQEREWQESADLQYRLKAAEKARVALDAEAKQAAERLAEYEKRKAANDAALAVELERIDAEVAAGTLAPANAEADRVLAKLRYRTSY